MNKKKILGIIGGSGLYDIDGLVNKKWVKVNSIFGEPSDEILFAELDGLEIRFLPRHGRGHLLTPSEINYKANIEALKKIGVTEIISISAVGSLREDYVPGDFVLVDQFVDRTHSRESTFFQNGLVAHYDFESTLTNKKNEKEIGVLKHESGKTGDIPQFLEGHSGKALAFDGDVYCDFNRVGVFRKSEPFSIGIWVNIPKNLKEGVIFHKSNAERLYNFKGFHVYLKNNSFNYLL